MRIHTNDSEMSAVQVNHEISTEFWIHLQSCVPNFLTDITTTLQSTCNLDVSKLQADHVCWRTETDSEYTNLVKALLADPKHFTLLIESEIGGRPIATFKLVESISCDHHQIGVVEIPSPKVGSPYPKGLEHVEFVIGDGTTSSPWNNDTHQRVLNEFRNRYPNVAWNTKAMAKEVNPDISVPLKTATHGVCSAKFHLVPLDDVIAAEKSAV